MPLTGDAKREYQRKKMAERRAKTGTNETAKTNGTSDRKAPYRDEHGDLVLELPTRADHNATHYWGWISKARDGTRVCAEFEFAPGYLIGGCGMVKAWEGKLLDGGTDLAKVIADSQYFKEIQSKMPVTKDRR